MSALVVLGLMGAGTSTLAAAVAERLGRTVRDSDLDIGRMLRDQLANRGPFLEQLADLRLDATLPVPELVDQVVAAAPPR